MSKRIIYAKNDTFISKNHRYTSYGKIPYLLIGKGLVNLNSNNDINIALLEFDLVTINDYLNVNKVEIYLKIQTEEKYLNSGVIEVYKVLESYSNITVNWVNGPKLETTGLFVNTSSINEKGYISIDVSKLVNEWINEKSPNFALALMLKNSNRIISIWSSRVQYAPYLKID